jgi:hypothetical protein
MKRSEKAERIVEMLEELYPETPGPTRPHKPLRTAGGSAHERTNH